MKYVHGIEIPETTPEFVKTFLDADLKARTVNPTPHSEFSSPGKATSALLRRGFVIEWVDTKTGRGATWAAEPGTCTLMLKANGLAFVRFAGDPPEYTIHDQQFTVVPRFLDSEGVVTWLYRGFGFSDIALADVLGAKVDSFAVEPRGWEGRFSKYIPLPEAWLPEPAHIRSLRPIPAVLRSAITRLQEQKEES